MVKEQEISMVGYIKELLRIWDVKDILAEIYNLYQEYTIEEDEEDKLYMAADPDEHYNSPADYWFAGHGCLPLWEKVNELKTAQKCTI